MEINLIFLISVIPAIILFGIAKSGLGGSIALISIPLMTLSMSLTEALAIMLPILIFSDFIAVYRFRKDYDLETLKLIIPSAAIGIIIGSFTFSVCTIVAGFTSFCVHAGGTPTSIYLLPLRLKKEIYVGTRVIFFTFVNLIKLPLYIHLSMMNTGTLINSILLFPLSILGIYIGFKLLKIIEENLFYNIIYALIFISSSKMLYDFLI